MKRGHARAFLIAILLVGTFGAAVCLACQVPVFRFALERWAADPYGLVITPGAGGDLTEDEESVVELLRSGWEGGGHPFNLRVIVEAEGREDREGATMDLYYPQQVRGLEVRPIWSGEVNRGNATRILESPARREISTRLLQGQSAVFVVVESGNSAADQKAVSELEEFSAGAAEVLEIPDGVVSADAADEGVVDPSVNPDNILRSKVPLKIEFSVLSISREAAEEDVFLTMLLNLESDLSEYAAEPMVFPVFGRGRVLEPLIGRGIHRDNVLDYASYLCGACSCEVKDQNPGMDLLVRADWESAIEGSEVVLEKVLPPLEGVSSLLDSASEAGNGAAEAEVPSLSSGEEGEGAVEASGGFSGRLLAVIGMVLLGIGVASFFVVSRGQS